MYCSDGATNARDENAQRAHPEGLDFGREALERHAEGDARLRGGAKGAPAREHHAPGARLVRLAVRLQEAAQLVLALRQHCTCTTCIVQPMSSLRVEECERLLILL